MSLEVWETAFLNFKARIETQIDELREKMKKSSHPEKYQKHIDEFIQIFETARQTQLDIFAEKQRQHQQEMPHEHLQQHKSMVSRAHR